MPDDNPLELNSPPGLTEESQSSDDSKVDEEKEETQETAPEDNFIRIPVGKDVNTYQEVQRLIRENPEFANAFNQSVGNKAKRQYQPQIDELNTRLQMADNATRRMEIQGMDEEAIEQRFANDPSFAREYTETVHPQDNSAQLENMRVLGTIQNLFSAAVDQGLPEEKVEGYLKDIQAGKYDSVSHAEAIGNLQSVIYQDLATLTPSASAKTDIPASQPAQKVDTATPDMSGNSSSPNTGQTWSFDEIRAMNPEQMVKTFPNDEDYMNAVRAGRITGFSSETMEQIKNG